MYNNLNIIAIRKLDCQKAYLAFEELMNKTESLLNEYAKIKTNEYKKFSTLELEQESVRIIQQSCKDTPFRPEEIKLISGQKFPDIIAENYYGIEVKSTKSNHWTSTGSSIVESTRDVNVEDIYMLFGKMGGTIPEFRCRPYEDVLYDIAVTHSPRYLINMELKKNETIFAKMGTTYNELRKSPKAIDKVRKYYKNKAKENHKQEMPWWITSENSDNTHYFNIRLWNSISAEEKKLLIAICMILFPEALNPKQSPTKYNQTSLWLCSYQQIVNPNIRDMYSAGGKITQVNEIPLNKPIPQIFNKIVLFSDLIKQMLLEPTNELIMLIEDYNPYLLNGKSLFENWINMCEKFADEFKVPLRDWIQSKPQFTFSQ